MKRVISISDYLQMRLKEVDGIGASTAERIAAYFGTISDFINSDEIVLSNISYMHNNKIRQIRLNAHQLEQIEFIKGALNDDDSLSALYSRYYISKFIIDINTKINNTTLDDLNCNPFLAASLGIDRDVKEFFKFNTWAFLLRSIVTSFGTVVENLLKVSSENNYTEKSNNNQENWDLIKLVNDVKHCFEIKSGPNDMDKTQIERYKKKLTNTEKKKHFTEKGYFGFTYGNLDSGTVTLGLLESYLDDWQDKTKIGRDLWAFLSDEEGYAQSIISLMRDVIENTLSTENINLLINNQIHEIIKEFNERFENLDEYLETQF